MDKLKFSSIFMMLLLLLVGFTSCSEEEGNEIGAPKELLKTWYTSDGSSITFRGNGTGTLSTNDADYVKTRAWIKIAFTYIYEDADDYQKLTLSFKNEPEPEVFYITELTKNNLELRDDEGDYIYLSSKKENEDDSDDEMTPEFDLSKETLTGKWGFCNETVWDVRDSILYWKENGQSTAYSISLSGRLIYIHESDGAVGTFFVHEITDEFIVLSDEDSPYEKFFFFKMEDDGNIIGDISLLYDKRWQTAPGVENVSLIFSKDGTASFKSDTDGAFSCSYTYDRANKVIHMKSPYGDADMVLVKLTQNTLIVNVISEEDGVRDEEMLEFRILD